MDSNRRPTSQEEKLLLSLVAKSSRNIPDNWSEHLLVRSMEDGGMGSLSLFPEGVINENRAFGESVSSIHFNDKDGVAVIASLYLDEERHLFELDIWKTDFSKLIELPIIS